MNLADDSKMPFGKFKDVIMEDIPAWYLLNLKGLLEINIRPNYNEKLVLEYINENIDVLDKQKGEENIYSRGD